MRELSSARECVRESACARVRARERVCERACPTIFAYAARSRVPRHIAGAVARYEAARAHDDRG
eukprot:5730237-Pleurochrysis_carterae.AAC.1